jgi:lysozyme
MTGQERERLRQQLVMHEGLRLRPYKDTVGKMTIGVGRNLDDMGISEEEAYYLLDNDITRCIRELSSTFLWFKDLDAMRQRVFVDLCFNLGLSKLSAFTETLKAMTDRDYDRAAECLKESRWHRQVGKRAEWLIQALRTGVEPPRI